jgi:hypothetical protein
MQFSLYKSYIFKNALIACDSKTYKKKCTPKQYIFSVIWFKIVLLDYEIAIFNTLLDGFE